MNYNNNDIIIAQSTPIGSSALAMIRVSGDSLSSFMRLIFGNKKTIPRYCYAVQFKSFDSKEVVDRCVITYYQAPKSFTGEMMLEISCHGNQLIVEKIINEFILKGVRVALPGEFSYRAFQNNKIDLMQAESIGAKITANSQAYGVALQNIENGSVSEKFLLLKDRFLKIVSVIEHELDFNEEEITHLSVKKIKNDFQKMKNDLFEIVKHSKLIKKQNQGYRVVIIGYPNVGKSTLFNKIIGVDKSIVTPIKGTTRDALEINIKINNVPFTFYDTAGYRKTKNQIEGIGIKRGLALLRKADIVLVVDQKNPTHTMDSMLEKGLINNKQMLLCVQTKCDKLKKGTLIGLNKIKLSAQQNVGVDLLLTHLSTIIIKKLEGPSYKNIVLCSERQLVLAQEAYKKIEIIINDLQSGCTMDIVASGCRDFIDVIKELLGEITSENVLNNIFKGFCVGK